MSLNAPQKITITKSQLKIIAGRTQVPVDQVEMLLKSLLQYVLEQTLVDVENYIMKIVPVRTGELRNDFLLKLRNSNIKGLILTIFLKSDFDYASRVNQMSRYQVRHSGTWYEHPNRRGYRAKAKDKYGNWVYLNDPTAEGHFFDKLVEFTKDRLLLNLARGKQIIAQGSKLTVRGMSAVSG